jgi:hypothetical protein
MRFVSPVALGLMLALAGVSAAVPSVVIAKEKAPAAPKLKLSPEFTAAAIKVDQAIAKKDVAGAAAALAAAEPLAKVPDEIYYYNNEMLNLSIVSKDAALQGKALEGLLNTGLVPAAQVAQFSAISAQHLLEAKNYDGALARGQAALAVGYNPAEVNAIIAQAYWGKAGTGSVKAEPARTNVANGLAAFKSAIAAMKAAGQPVPSQWYSVALGKADSINAPDAADWAQMAYEADPSGPNLRNVILFFQRATPAMASKENLDLMRLVQISGAMTMKIDFLEYTDMAFKTGIYGEVKAGIEAGRGKGALTAADGADTYAIATQRIAADKASLAASEAHAAKAVGGKEAAATADAYLGYGDYAKAVTLYRTALQKGQVDANEVNTRIGVALARSGDFAGAKDAFGQVSGGTRGQIARYWLLWLSKKAA